MTDHVQTRNDIIKAAGISENELADLTRKMVIPPPVATCSGVWLYAAYTSNIIERIIQRPDKPVWTHANAPLIETVNVTGAAILLDLPPERVVRALRNDQLPPPALTSRNDVYWFRRPFVQALESIHRSVRGLRRPRRLNCDVCFNAVYSGVGSKLNLDRYEFDARLIHVSDAFAKWQIDTSSGVTYIALSDSSFTVRFLLPVNAACNEFA